MNRLNDYTKLMKMYGGFKGLSPYEKTMIIDKGTCDEYKKFLETLLSTINKTTWNAAKNLAGTPLLKNLVGRWETDDPTDYKAEWEKKTPPNGAFNIGTLIIWAQAKITAIDAILASLPAASTAAATTGASGLTKDILDYIAKAAGAVSNVGALGITTANIGTIDFNLLVVEPPRAADNHDRVIEVCDALAALEGSVVGATPETDRKLRDNIDNFNSYASVLP
jgi:hypothetical protein